MMLQNSLNYNKPYRTMRTTTTSNQFKKSFENSGTSGSYQSRWKNEDEVPNLGPFSDIYESAKNHVQFTQLIVRGSDGTLLNSRHERKKVPVYMRGT